MGKDVGMSWDRCPKGRDRSPKGRDRSPNGRDRSPKGRDRKACGDDREVKAESRYQSETVGSDPMGGEVEEIARVGNFENWSTARVKVDSNSDPSLPFRSSSKTVISTISQQMSVPVSEHVERLHRKVTTKVRMSFDKYYPGAAQFEPEQHKICTPEEYRRLAKQFSHELRGKIKESYEAYNSTLDGIVLTGDHEQIIRMEIESYFEGIERI